MDVLQAERLADELITAELAKSNQMWGRSSERSDAANGELMLAGMAQLDALYIRHLGDKHAFEEAPEIFPENWSGFRDYGSDIANIVVTIAFLTQEVKRKLMIGEDYIRLERGADQVYRPATGLPNTIEA
ncbi:hypothetical protein [Bradyrhizobium ottawaense]|uniref:Uncharacterized protein n=1 Tax=Bradyrhizobium ottawaense TaxID=931866 RepID=A0ABY0QHH3_9BRAD|nr:hypothetical protein [Bradyrhizobium ottawaense]SDH37814.1 hypothetical protein SAMN05444163_0011 [Bradyrhizobium ottawaense]SDK46161.1 hypothetical protein SAMN05444163_8170 [Bradyrhizobium ottawaense]